MKKRWIVKPEGEKTLIDDLKEILNVDPLVASLLVQRGITDYESARSFFRPSLKNLHDPFLMKDMDIAVERLKTAIDSNEKILIYGDYDVDGTTAVALMHKFLSLYTTQLGYYIPKRETEGYGISKEGINYAEENGFTLIIALDCGIKAIENIQYAKEKNIEFIICDHHLQGDEIPEAVAVLDPKRNDCNYPYKELSGCGVGFKFLQAYSIKNDLDLNNVYYLLDLVAISIASDIVPITGENRTLAYYGLKLINEKPSVGINALKELANATEKEMNINDLVFIIGPRINAAGRMESGNIAVDLLISDNKEHASEIANNINSYNTERKEFDKNITEDALKQIEESPEMIDRKTTVLYNPEWHKGVIGIVASRLLEKYYRPTVLLTESNGVATGSARSVDGFDLYSAIDACSDLLESYGGHKHAAGLSMKIENVPLFIEKFEQEVAKTITDENLIPSIEIDQEIKLNQINNRFYNILNQFRPFGPGNMRPVFITKNVNDVGWSKLVGTNNEHMKIEISENGNNQRYSGICFNQADAFPTVKSGNPFDVCYVIDENNYRGRKNLQLRVKDIK